MCGISVLWVKHEDVDRYLPLYETACKHISYRGLDQAARTTISLGIHKVFAFHSRLSIRGGPVQHQPVTNSDGSVGLVFNGELYNLDQLAEAWGFRPAHPEYLTETAVLLWLCEKHWAEKDRWQTMLDGMYAIVAWHEDEIVALQDGWKIKPLFTQTLDQQGNCLFTSHPERQIEANQITAAELKHYLHYRYFQDLEYERVSGYSPFTRNDEARHSNLSYETEKISELIEEALSAVTVDQQQFGLLLSGGVDSTLLAALSQKIGINHQLIAYTAVDSTQPVTEDGRYASQAAMQYQCRWQPVTVGPELLLELPNLMQHFEVPIADVSGLLTWAICQQAKQDGVKVLLSGAGADELFCGYNRHQQVAELEAGLGLKFKAVETAVRTGLTAIDSLLPKHPYKERLLASQHFEKPSLIDLVRIQATWPRDAFRSPEKIKINHPASGPSSAVSCLVEHDRANYLPRQVLAVTDRASMLAQVEVRLPYLLQEISAFALGYSASEHIKHGPKWLLRSLLSELDGSLYANRKKEGFGINIDAWLRHPIGNRILQDLIAAESYLWEVISRPVAERMINEHLESKKSWGHQLFMLLSFYYWEQGRPT